MTDAHLDDAAERLELIRQSAASLLPREDGAARARALRFRAPGFDRAMWRQMCELGWAGLRVSEAQGGAGLDVAALCVVAQQLGASLSPEPFIASSAAAQFLQGRWLDEVLGGERIVVPAWMERTHALPPAISTTFRGGRVDGIKRCVPGALGADAFLVTTRDGLVVVPRDGAGVQVHSLGLHDGSFAADIVFTEAAGEALDQDALERFDEVFEACGTAHAAYLLGTMEAAFDLTLAYMNMRKQFGKPIGSFQALQHRAVDLKIQIELTRAVVHDAALACDRTDTAPDARRAVVSRARMRASDAAMRVVQEAVQFHGAMGMTDECDIGLYARKVLAVKDDWGSGLAHRQRFTRIECQRHD